jgi:hypothetical protein
MISAAVINKLRFGAIALVAGLALSTTTIAQARLWNGAVSLYETVRPPRDLASQVATTQASENFNLSDFNLFAYPKNAQATEHLATEHL